MKTLIKLDRFFAWVLLIGMIFYFVSGYGMTKGIIDQTLSAKIHLDYLTYLVLVAFMFHTTFAIHLAFKRWQIWNRGGKILLATFFSLFLGFFIYADKFYQAKSETDSSSTTKNPVTTSSNTATTSDENSDNTSNSANNTTPATPAFTVAELAKYDGKNGSPAYVAVDGNVYDLTSVFRSGKHYSHFAGKELTNAFYSYHAKTILARYPIVGKLAS